MYHRISHKLYRLLIEPKRTQADELRHEYILNVLLSGLLAASLVALIVSGLNFFSSDIQRSTNGFIGTVIFSALVLSLVWLSRSGHSRIASFLLVVLLALAILQLLLGSSFLLPEVGLGFAMIIVIAGVLLRARTGLYFAFGFAVTMLVVAYFQVNKELHPDLTWLGQEYHVTDALGPVVLFLIIGLVSWLSNREIDRSLDRALRSEAALALERDNLEVKVSERSRQLEAAQLIRTLELQRFAEFGRLSANLLHEVANPLTAASLNLELLDDKQSELVKQARKNLQQLERYVTAARKQLKTESEPTLFNARSEINQSLRLLQPIAHKAGVKLEVVNDTQNVRLFGDPVKFSQVFTNVIANAVDAYENSETAAPSRKVNVQIIQIEDFLEVTVKDWGKGIAGTQLEHIFEAFYTTKNAGRGMGIGLALVKQFVEQDFGGSITVTSNKNTGTIFTLRFSLDTRRHEQS